MKIKALFIIVVIFTIVSSCKTWQGSTQSIQCVFKTIKISKKTIDSLYICGKCKDSTESTDSPIDSPDTMCVKRLIFQFTDSILVKNTMNFYLTGWIGYRRKDSVEPEPLADTNIITNLFMDTIITMPFTFANLDWTRGEIQEFLRHLSERGCDNADYDYIALTPYINIFNNKRYLSLRASAVKNNVIIFSFILPHYKKPSDKSPNPRPPYPPQG